MTKDRNEFKAGLFIVVSIVLILGVIVAIKGVGHFIEPDQVRQAAFELTDDVSGLGVGDDVRIGGLRVGTVRSIRIEPARDASAPAPATTAPGGPQPRVIVRFSIPERISIRDGAMVSVQSTLTGTAWLNFSTLGQGNALAQDFMLDGAPSNFALLANSLGELAPEVQRLAVDIRTVTLPKVNATADGATQTLAAVRGKVEPIIERYNMVTTRLAETFVHLRDILGDSKGDIRGLLANLNSTTGTLKEKLPPLLDKFDATIAKIQHEVGQASGAMADVKATLANAKDASGAVRSLLMTNRGKIDGMIASLKTAGDNLKFATAEIRHSPWRLLYKPKPGEMANLNLYDATRQFAEGANDLSDAATALRDALKDPKTDQAKVEQLVHKLDETFGQFQKVETDLWQRVRE